MVIEQTDTDEVKWKFSELISDPTIKDRFEKVRKYFFLRESTYDMTNRCNIRCDGCYYFEGEKQFAIENKDKLAWKELMKNEKKRGITFVVLAGAEPSLVPDLCKICYDEISLGAVATNGIKYIPESIGYKIHISVWGDDQFSFKIRNARNMLKTQIENYQQDSRAIFVYTFTKENIEQVKKVTKIIADKGCKITFNMFSAPVGYTGALRHTKETLVKVRDTMIYLMEEFPQTVLFSYNNVMAHTHRLGLNDLYSCSYPRMNNSTGVGLGKSFRQYRTDLTWNRDAACCVPDTDCVDCRHYAAGSAIVTARLFRHATDPDTFGAWLDYVDTYLAVWVAGYKKSPNLINKFVAPPR